ncbi:MAG: hypothetical protein PHX20_01335 [Candidatus Omnitrophica bacterium]|nr:hypothetical protein [Candidatus Omnitrophota bacterium]MDD5436167.1 hypothetical protein [Candidatus Omnitrophota bacterium]
MNKRKTAAIAVLFFLVQAIQLTGIAPAENLSPNPLTEIKIGGANPSFKETCTFLCMALSIYRSDVFQRMTKEELTKAYDPFLAGSAIRFDLANLDIGKKGWTRYYPFSVGERQFVARIFLTKEAFFQPTVSVLSELVVEKLGVTLQVLPGIDEILADCKIKPNRIYPSSQAEKSA